MRLRLGLIECCGILLFGGYLIFFLLRHDPHPRPVPGLLAIAAPGYLQAAAQWNPLWLLQQSLGVAAAPFASAGLLLVLVFLFAGYFWVLRGVRFGMQPDARLGTIIGGVLLFSLPLLFSPYLLSNDIYPYIMYGRIAAIYGENPALVAPNAFANDPFLPYVVAWQSIPSVYGPVWTIISHALTLLIERMGGQLWLYLLAYKLTMLAAHLASTLLIWQIVAAWKPNQRAYAALLYGWNPMALFEFAGNAHNDALMICLILLGIWCTQRGNWRVAIVALLAAALVKWIAVLLLPLWAIYWLGRLATWRARLAFDGQAAAIAIAAAALLYLPYGHVLQSIGAPLQAQGRMQAENSLSELLIRVGQEAFVRLGSALAHQPAWREAAEATVVDWGKALVLLAWLVALYSVWRQPTFENLIRFGCWLLLVLLLLAPIFRVWYATWPLALAALLEWRPAGRTIASLAAAAPFLYVQAASPAWMDALIFIPALVLLAYELWQAYRPRIASWAGSVGASALAAKQDTSLRKEL
jgi:hypothetical protein